jgi:hypothetical protein
MSDHHDQIGAALAQSSRAGADYRRGIIEPKSSDVGSPCSGRRKHGCEPDHSDFRAAEGDQRVIANPGNIASVSISDIRAEYRVLRVAHAGAQCISAPVEFVVAERGGDVAHAVVVVHNGASECEVGRWRPLEHVPAIEEQCLANRSAFPPRRFDHGGDICRASAHDSTSVGAGLQSTMKVVCRDDAKPWHSRRERAGPWAIA